MSSIGAAAASGLESGFRMAQGFQDRKDRKEESDRDFELRKHQLNVTEARQSKLDTRQDAEYAGKVADDLHKDTVGEFAATTAQYGSWETTPPEVQARLSRKANAAGQAADAARKRSTELAFGVQAQKAKDIITNLQTGRIKLTDVPDTEYAVAVADALGDPRQYLRGKDGSPSPVESAVQDVTNGMSTQNHGMWVRGANVLLADDLQRPVGTEGAHGGQIVGQELLDFIPHPTNPNLVSPVVRVYVDQGKQFVGPRGKSNSTAYYDAPITEDRSTGPDAKVKWLDMKQLLDKAGQKAVAAEALNHPEARAKLEAGLVAGREQVQGHLDTYRALSAPKKTYTETVTNMAADSGSTMIRKFDAQGREVGREEVKHKDRPLREGAIDARLRAIDKLEASGEFSPAEGDEAVKAALGIRPRVGRGGGAGGAGGGGKITESNLAGTLKDVAKAITAKHGLEYDSLTKTLRAPRGSKMTPAEIELKKVEVAAAYERAATKVRDDAAQGHKPLMSAALEAATKQPAAAPASKPAVKTVKWDSLK